MCLPDEEEWKCSHQGDRYEQYRRWTGEDPDLFSLGPLDALLNAISREMIGKVIYSCEQSIV
jgi:hypothetical protein